MFAGKLARSLITTEKPESRAMASRTARCCCKFRAYVSNFTTASCGFSATARLSCVHHCSDRSNAEITHSTLIFTAITQNRKSRRRPKSKRHGDAWIRDYLTALISVRIILSVPAYVRYVWFRHGVRYLTLHIRGRGFVYPSTRVWSIT